MGIKHQTESYRTIGGIQWPCLMDILSAEHDAEIKARKASGARIRIIKIDGFRRAFIHPHDLAA
jgi:hypothetical protein